MLTFCGLMRSLDPAGRPQREPKIFCLEQADKLKFGGLENHRPGQTTVESDGNNRFSEGRPLEVRS